MSLDSDAAAARLRTALELAELATLMMEQNLRRRHPAASDPEIRRLLGIWQRTRPGAEDGDCVGRPIPLSRFRV
jgi:hypothetical protein